MQKIKAWCKENKRVLLILLASMLPMIVSTLTVTIGRGSGYRAGAGSEVLIQTIPILWILWIIFNLALENQERSKEVRNLRFRMKAQNTMLMNKDTVLSHQREYFHDLHQELIRTSRELEQVKKERLETKKIAQNVIQDANEIREMVRAIEGREGSKKCTLL